MRKKIGLLGGTFDPIHLGHLNLAIEFLEKADLKEVWFIPAKNPTLREGPVIATPEQRMEMTQLAVKDFPHGQVIDLEMKRQGPSYTIDTVKEILENNKNFEFYLLLGEDIALSLPKWKEPIPLVSMIPLLVGCRSGFEMQKKISNIYFPEALREAIQKGIVETKLMDIEGRVIRKRLKERLYCSHLLPAKVLDYIYQNQLYFNA